MCSVALTVLLAQLFLPPAGGLPLPVAQTSGSNRATPNLGGGARDLYRMKLLMTVTSDWTVFSITNPDIWLFNITTNLIQGENAVRGLGSNTKNISLGKASMDETKVVLEAVVFLIGVDQVLDFSFATLKGDIGYVNVTLYNYNPVTPSLIGSYNNTGTVPSYPGINLRQYSVDSELVTAGGPVGTVARGLGGGA